MTVNTNYKDIESYTTSGVVKIDINDILFIEPDKRCCYIHHTKGVNFFRISAKELEVRYPNTFFRCNKQYVVPLKRIVKIDSDIEPAIIEIEGSDEFIEVSYEKAQTLSFLLNQITEIKPKVDASTRQEWIINYLRENKKASTLAEDFVSKYIEAFGVKKKETGYRIPRVATLSYDLNALLKKGMVVRYKEGTEAKLALEGLPFSTWWFELSDIATADE